MTDRINQPPHEERPDWSWEDDRKAGCGSAIALLIIGAAWGLFAVQAVIAWA